MAVVELSDSAAIFILASIAVTYFSATAAISVVICRFLCCRKQCVSLDLPAKLPNPLAVGKNQYELTEMKGGDNRNNNRDSTDLVPGGRAGRWRQYMSSSQQSKSNGMTHSNGNHSNGYTQERPKLPAIEEAGAGEEEEEKEGGGGGGEGRKGGGGGGGGSEITAASQKAEEEEEDRVRDREARSRWMAKRKVRGRTSSTKLLLEETDGSGSSWTLTSGNGINGSVVGDMMSSLTASLPGSILAQCGGSDQPSSQIQPVPIPRPVPGKTRSESPVVLHSTTSTPGDASSLRHGPSTEVELHNGMDSPSAMDSPSSSIKHHQRARRTKQLSLSTHSLPRHSIATTAARALGAQISSGSGTLRAQDDSSPVVGGGSRPRLRRYASTTSYTSTPSDDPVLLVRPRSRTGSRRGSFYNSNTLGKTTFDHQDQFSSITSMEMEGNYYTLQTRRSMLGRAAELESRESGRAGREGSSGSSWTLPTRENTPNTTSSKEDLLKTKETSLEQCRPITFRISSGGDGSYNHSQRQQSRDVGYTGPESIV